MKVPDTPALKLPCCCWELNPGTLEDQPVFLTAESSSKSKKTDFCEQSREMPTGKGLGLALQTCSVDKCEFQSNLVLSAAFIALNVLNLYSHFLLCFCYIGHSYFLSIFDFVLIVRMKLCNYTEGSCEPSSTSTHLS